MLQSSSGRSIQSRHWQGFPISKLVSENSLFRLCRSQLRNNHLRQCICSQNLQLVYGVSVQISTIRLCKTEHTTCVGLWLMFGHWCPRDSAAVSWTLPLCISLHGRTLTHTGHHQAKMDKGDSGSPWEYVCGGCEWVCECVGGCVSVWVGVCVRGGGCGERKMGNHSFHLRV